MKKDIISEVYRIQQIMGISTLMEQPLPPRLTLKFVNALKNFGDDIFKYVSDVPSVRRVISATGRDVTKLTRDHALSLISNLTDDGVRALTKYWYDNNLLFRPESKQNMIDLFSEKIIKEPDRYWDLIDQLNDGKDTFWTLYPSAADVPPALQKIADELVNFMKKSIDDYIEVDYPNVWKTIKKRGWTGKKIKQVSPASTEIVTTLYKKLDPNILKRFTEKITGSFKSLSLSAEQIQELIAKYKVTDSAGQAQIEEILESSLTKLAMDSSENFKWMRGWIEQNLVNDPELIKIKEKLLRSENWKMAEILSSTTINDKRWLALSEAWKYCWKGMHNLFRDFRIFFAVKFWTSRKIPQEFMDKLNNSWFFHKDVELEKPLRNWILSGTKRGFPFRSNPNYHKIYQIAGTKTAVLSYSAEVIFNLLKFHLYWAVLETLIQMSAHGLVAQFNEKNGRLYKFIDYLEGDYVGSEESASTFEAILGVIQNFIRNTFDEVRKISNMEGVVQYFPGYWDNIALGILQSIESVQKGIKYTPNSEIVQRTAEQTREFLTQQRDSITDQANNLIRRGQAEIASEEGQGPAQPQVGPRETNQTASDTTYNANIGF